MIHIDFDHSYARDLPDACMPVKPEFPPAPALLYWNAELAEELGLDSSQTNATELAAAFSGAALPAGARPVAQAYAGHQFGGLSPSLGDGRALLLGEVMDRNGQRRDIAFKGSGRTPFSRRGDGKAAVGPMLRELIIGEAMHALAIPSTRALAVAATGETVYREQALPGAVLTRVAASHLRVGTFQYFAIRGERDMLRRLADYTLARHYPGLAGAEQPYLALLQAVAERQAELIARWMHAGFIHGVMNTDNMALSGETIDYGPCSFMDIHHPSTVFSSIDSGGRYAYGNQPAIAQWNLARLAETLLPLLDPDEPKNAVPAATTVIEDFAERYQAHWLQQARRKLGLSQAQDIDQELAEDWLALLARQDADHTLAWRRLADAAEGQDQALTQLFNDPAAAAPWLARWRQRLDAEPQAAAERAAALRQANPLYIPRNHLVEEALAAASDHGDMGPTLALLDALRQPFNERAGLERYTLPAAPEVAQGYRTFCGT
ncbi:protein adenylyltransferase SelO [Chromobacterium haemolyticum]|uniref:protein adenylyltransferase SelO n=1 Tax=Chromobacterium haemolyticum TaxID=394935 RepID=UPI00244CB10D|nr:YdiU family protein [Chromobacterium haemolyticum]MDH0344294.1 YdiU family protein [Chromobacterium haemolyticum]